VVDAANAPTSPVSPNPKRNMLLALVGGVFLAIGMGCFVEYMDKTIATPDQIRAQLRLQCLGLVPVTGGRRQKAEAPLLNNGVPAAFQEAFRAVRTNVLFSSRDEPIRTILVTSTGPNEGKTVVASNLAISLAQTGQRVLLLDADMRRPRVHDMFRMAQAPGLSEVTTHRAVASQVIARTSVPGLWILPAGSIPPNPSELVSSDVFSRFIRTLSQFFDWVIVDSPPVMAVTDAALLAHVVAGVLFVVAAEQANGSAASNALDQLDTAQARFLGAVLNKVNFKRNGFYYADYYRREYADYYTSVTSDTIGHAGAR
jgi:capsular exopolysaccharide synthesis family protein